MPALQTSRSTVSTCSNALDVGRSPDRDTSHMRKAWCALFKPCLTVSSSLAQQCGTFSVGVVFCSRNESNVWHAGLTTCSEGLRLRGNPALICAHWGLGWPGSRSIFKRGHGSSPLPASGTWQQTKVIKLHYTSPRELGQITSD